MTYIIKNGKWLAYKEYIYEEEFDPYSDIHIMQKAEWSWIYVKYEAKEFGSSELASSFLVRRNGEFWNGASVVSKFRY